MSISTETAQPLKNYFAPHIAGLAGYVPGEQSKHSSDIIKLNTNENPYPPSPKVAKAITALLGRPLQRYPEPMADTFRRAAAEQLDVPIDWILAGNGSDDMLTVLIRTFSTPGDVVAYPTPSYVLYKTLINIQGARPVEIPFDDTWDLDDEALAATEPRLVFLANPNGPSGTVQSPERVARLATRLDAPLVVDEAYVDFAESSCVGLVKQFPNVVVTRSLSKGYGLAGLRFGYLVARPELIAGLAKVKDSYNCDMLSIAGASAAVSDQDYLAQTRAKIIATRTRLIEALRSFGFRVTDSQANFAWATDGPEPRPIYEYLKDRGILIRHMNYPGRVEGLRISVGTDDEVDRCLDQLRAAIASSA